MNDGFPSGADDRPFMALSSADAMKDAVLLEVSMLRKLLSAAAFVLLGVGAAQAEPLPLTFWHSLSNQGEIAVNRIVEAFNASQDKYKVKAELVGPYEDAVTKLQAAIPARRGPDLLMLEVTRYGLFAGRGVLEPLDPYLEREGAAFREAYLPFALAAARYQGKSYVLPFNVSTPVMFYNKDAFVAAGLDPEKPPKTWDELLDAARKIAIREGEEVKRWGVNTPAQFPRWGFVAQAGGEWVSPEDSTVLMDSPGTIKAYRFAADLVNVHKVASREAAIKEQVAKQYFITGQSGIHFGSTGDFGDMRKAVKFNLGVAPLPCEARCAAPIGGATIGIAAYTTKEKKDGAWAFLRFISDAKQNAILFVATGYLPIMKDTAGQPEARAAIEGEPGYSVAINQLPVAFARARPPAMAAMRAKENSVWESIVLGQKSAEDALKAFAADMRGLMAQN
jgi:sn-glycerol 3-phosphate transport system substrate-binding protein